MGTAMEVSMAKMNKDNNSLGVCCQFQLTISENNFIYLFRIASEESSSWIKKIEIFGTPRSDDVTEHFAKSGLIRVTYHPCPNSNELHKSTISYYNFLQGIKKFYENGGDRISLNSDFEIDSTRITRKDASNIMQFSVLEDIRYV